MDTTQPWGLVHGYIYRGVGDSNDAGRVPDLAGVSGDATFTVVGVDKYIDRTPTAQKIIVPGPIKASVVNGQLQWAGAADVPLVANLDATGTTLGWQWAVAFTLTDSSSQPVTLVGWKLDVKIYDPNAALVNGDNPTVTQLTDQAPVTNTTLQTLAKGDPGNTIDLQKGTLALTTDPTQVNFAIVPTANPLVKAVNMTLPSTGGGTGGGGAGTVTKVAGQLPDQFGAITLGPTDVGAASPNDVSTVATAAAAAQTTANAAGSSAASAQSAANAAIAALSSYATLASPALTGNPTAPTPATSDNDTTVATTAFVQALFAQFFSLLVNVGHVGCNATTHTWPPRPSTSGPVIWWSINDATITTRPAGMLAGDGWVPAPGVTIP